jgi:hypothetical protein
MQARQRTTLPPLNTKEKLQMSLPFYSPSGIFYLRPNSAPQNSAIYDIFGIYLEHLLQGHRPNLPSHPYPTWMYADSSRCTMSALGL